MEVYLEIIKNLNKEVCLEVNKPTSQEEDYLEILKILNKPNRVEGYSEILKVHNKAGDYLEVIKIPSSNLADYLELLPIINKLGKLLDQQQPLKEGFLELQILVLNKVEDYLETQLKSKQVDFLDQIIIIKVEDYLVELISLPHKEDYLVVLIQIKNKEAYLEDYLKHKLVLE